MNFLRQTLRVFQLSGIFILLAGCHTEPPVKSINSEFNLTEGQIIQYTDEATHGDSAAALSLYEYYNRIKSDDQSAVKWLSVAATNNPSAQYLVARFYSGDFSSKMVDTNMALYWYCRAANGGDTNAIAKLKELGVSPSSR